jgi:hypothetical protein
MRLHLESLWRGGKRRIMNTAHLIGFLVLISVLVFHAQESGMIENSSVAWQWNLTGGQFASRFINKANGEALPIGSECFKLELGDAEKGKVKSQK